MRHHDTMGYMARQTTALRALTAYVAQRSLRFASIIVFGTGLLILILIGALAYNVSEWFWLLAVPVIILLLLALLIRFIVRKIIKRIYRHPLSTVQRDKLAAFFEKLKSLVEARSLSLPAYAMITVKDILIHRDATTVKETVKNAGSLKSDFSELTRHFPER